MPGRTCHDPTPLRPRRLPVPSRKTTEPESMPGTTLLLAPGHEAGLAHGYPAARERLVPPPFGRAEVSAGSGRSACLRSRCRSPDTRARPPMLPVDTSGGRRYVTCHLRASALPVPVRFGTGHRLVGTGAEGSRRAEMPSGVYCARENQARAVPHIPRTFTPEGISAPSEPDVHPKFRPAKSPPPPPTRSSMNKVVRIHN